VFSRAITRSNGPSFCGRPDIGEEIELLAEEHRGIDLALVRILEVVGRGWPQDQPVGNAGFAQQIGTHRGAVALQAFMPDRLLFDGERQAEPVRGGPEHRKRRGRNLGPDTIARQHQKLHHDRSLISREEVNAGALDAGEQIVICSKRA
jgi:hypothetical protein